ncbi:MAG: ActS/PrrB/RegB family redox-sensitive histidine kinase [Rhodospirillaceae bacterium]|jgi:two-component system, sensor histidine kinase RegB|nr:ActS/PrrB/RegB family redox-sensitive histidine kinase [Rhodospirillaceae bacterium]MBT5194351.1 ActS/PrrB/RegB family redox-sensitive histidine kinase [Rhodospirillaceae bacterium]MBT5897102.1 ActS/PrrB/RegB family redox-sensitive histidine kinase [Rhodospirillaceae bacterium]MBT6427593.1 ActS/PrrB/RegB family redox-sensitive histidine kinase [Rhodospirillaceae bacterium]MBT7760718.1 ActS/PrrB/RegB family redox-sensitive histidine kinase [Rhodospirillaceae bacterium]
MALTDGIAPPELTRPAMGQVRVRTLLAIRWLAIAGQVAALLVVDVFLDFELPMLPAMAAIAASAVVNFWIIARYRLNDWHHDRAAAIYLAFDIVQLAVLLYLTGGLDNPFALLFLVPVTISATILSLRSAVYLGLLAFICVSLLAVFHLPLPWPEPGFRLPPLYDAAIWISLVVGTTLLMFYAWRVAEESRRMSDALAATQATLSKEQEMSALGGLAAAAAHELGTPLGTIALITKELLHDQPPDGETHADLEVLNGEVARCRDILASLARNPSAGTDPAVSRMAFDALISDAADLYGDDETEMRVTAKATTVAPLVRRSPEIIQGLGNLIENAAEFSANRVDLEFTWDETLVELSIADDGPGFPPNILGILGDPYISTRPGSGRMGLGVFISKTLLERTGGSLHFFNHKQGQGATVVIRWPRHIIELTEDQPMGSTKHDGG